MNRTVVSGIAAFALLIGASLMLTETTAEAARCGGGLIAKMKAKRAAKCCAPEPVCCQPAPTCGGRVGLLAKLKAKRAARKCCAPEPTCCPEPAPCCAPEPAPCCAPAPCCGGEVAAAPAPCCGGGGEVVQGAVVSDQGFDLAPGETLVPGSVQTVGGGEAAAASSSDAEMPAPAAEAAGEAPPAPKPDANTDI